MLSWIFIVLGYWNNSPRVDITPLGHINLIPSQPVFALSGLVPTIYRTRGKHTSHYATDAVSILEIHSICERYIYIEHKNYEKHEIPKYEKDRVPSCSVLHRTRIWYYRIHLLCLIRDKEQWGFLKMFFLLLFLHFVL
jgi:hypothetical protein